MLLFNRLGGGKFSENATLLNKIDESSKLLRRVALFDRHPDGVLEMLLFNRLGLRTAATGFAGISSNAASTSSLAAFELSRVFRCALLTKII